MIKAVIDLGTNTFNLLIAKVDENGFQVLHSEKEGVAIGMGGINEKRITDEAKSRALNTLNHFKSQCESRGVQSIMAFGTSALRDASNGKEFVAEVWKQLSLKVQIISGVEEADLIYQGVKKIYSFPKEAVIMDIGGGSTELIWANENGVMHAESFDIGVSRIYQHFQMHDPISLVDEQNIIRFLEEKTKGKLKEISSKTMIGSSGSFETFYELIHSKPFPKENKLLEIDKGAMLEIIEVLKKSTLAQRQENQFILPIRKLMAPITAVKTLWFMEQLGIEKIIVSPYSLKEGALFTDNQK